MKLIEPNEKYLESYQAAIKEYEANNIEHTFFGTNKVDIINKIRNFHEGIDLKPGYVKATHLWLVEDDCFIGEVSIRHELTESLLKFGGHIGYGIRCSKWNMGYATKMLALALIYIKKHFVFDKVLITCNIDNYASAKVIEKNGGILQDIITNKIDGKERLTKRYWISLE